MYGHDVPLNHEQVMELDHKNETGSVGAGDTYESEGRPGETRTHDQDIGRMLPGGTISQDISDIRYSYPDLYPGSIEPRPHWHIQGNNKQLQTCGVRKPVETRKGSMLIGGRRIILMTLIWICLVTRIGIYTFLNGRGVTNGYAFRTVTDSGLQPLTNGLRPSNVPSMGIQPLTYGLWPRIVPSILCYHIMTYLRGNHVEADGLWILVMNPWESLP